MVRRSGATARLVKLTNNRLEDVTESSTGAEAADPFHLTPSDVQTLLRASAPSFEHLRDEYTALLGEMEIRRQKLRTVDRIIDSIVANKNRYLEVERRVGVPWFVVATIHNLEGSLNFRTHLHNGDPLSARTTHVPRGRPVSGNPPFTWEESATDALTFDGLASNHDWSIQKIAYLLEGFNGWGYRLYHPSVKTPYLWSYSTLYERGKYAADGRWSPTFVSDQCGGMVLLHRLAERDATVGQALRQDMRELIASLERPLAIAESFEHADLPSFSPRMAKLEAVRSISSVPTRAASATGQSIVDLAQTRIGQEYIYGADVPINDPNWSGPWDCAEFTTWVLYQVSGIVFGCVDNTVDIRRLEPWGPAWYRDALASGIPVSIPKAKQTPGALYVRKKLERPAHVAISDGKGRTIEAMDHAHGVTSGAVDGRLWHAVVLIAGISY